ncbi:MAG: hypothetical protein IJF44_03470 [Clostridia bacterium]|nr:hypothetical protein [Clostridia bacterium]
MIDFHTHVLPRLDDGAKDSRAALAILQNEKQQGVTCVLCTSHYYGKKYAPEQFLTRRNAAYARIKEEVPEGVSLRLGAEVHFTGVNVAEYDELRRLCIEGTDYILIEFPFMQKWSGELFNRLADFMAETDCVPIIAHVERYREVLKNPAIINELLAMGCLLQVNTSAFLNRREKSLAFALLRRNAVHCIGTDAHDEGTRAPNWTETKAAIEKAGLLKEFEGVQQTMSRILANERVEVGLVPPIKKLFGKYR